MHYPLPNFINNMSGFHDPLSSTNSTTNTFNSLDILIKVDRFFHCTSMIKHRACDDYGTASKHFGFHSCYWGVVHVTCWSERRRRCPSQLPFKSKVRSILQGFFLSSCAEPDCAQRRIKYTLCCVEIMVWLGRKHSATAEKTHIVAIHSSISG